MNRRTGAAGLAALIMVLAGCTAKIIVTKVPLPGVAAKGETPPKPTAKEPMNGVYYALPRTVLKVELPIERTSAEAGKYVVYLPIFFPRLAEAQSAVSSTGTSYKPGKAVILATGEPDPENVYYLKTTSRGPIDRTGLMEYTEQGTVSGASASADNVTTDIALSVLTAVGGIASRVAGAATFDSSSLKCGTGEEKKTIPCLIKDGDATIAVDRDALQVNYSKLSAEQKSLVDDAAKAEKPPFLDALRAYALIYDLQNKRKNLRETDKPLAPEPLLKDYDADIATELAYFFVGAFKKESWTFTTELRPVELTETPELFRVHPSKGICFSTEIPVSDQPPSKFWLEGASHRCEGEDLLLVKQDLQEQLKKETDPVKREQLDKQVKAVDEKIAKLKGAVAGAKKLKAKYALYPETGQPFQSVTAGFVETGERGFRYRMPAMTKVSFNWEKVGAGTLSTSNQMIAQFGAVVSLPASAGGRTTGYKLKFYEATGALKSFDVTSKAILQKAAVDTAASQALSTYDAKVKAGDELALRERQAKIYSACKTMNVTCGGYTATPPPGTTLGQNP
jgi:hypothetical protein